MKKILLPVLVLIPAIWAGATWFTSQNSEAVLDEVLAQSNQQMAEAAPFLATEKTSFEKGFIQSSAQSVITISPTFFGKEEAESIQIGLNHKIYHGPIMLTPNGIKIGTSYIVTTLDQSSLSEEVKTIITTFFGEAEPFVSGVTTGASEMIDTDFTIAPFSIDAAQIAELTGESLGDDELEFSFAGFSGEITGNVQGTKMTGMMDIGEVTLKSQNGDNPFDVTMAASTIDVDVDELYKGSLLDGKIVMTIPGIEFSDGNGSGATFTEVHIISSAGQNDELMNAAFTFDINNMQIKSSNAGFDFPDSKVHTSGDISGIERTTIVKLIDLEQEMYQAVLLGNDDADALLSSTQAYYQAVGELIKQGVKMDSVIEISTAAGNAAVNLDLTYADAKPLIALKTVRDLAMAIQGKLTMNIDKSMLAGTPLEEAISMPVGMGFVVEKADHYESLAKLNKGELLLNGEPVPFLDTAGDQPLEWNKAIGM